jgi:cold-inducible RNA-binding protein
MSTKLYVGNVAFSTTEGSLRTLFEGTGLKVEDVAVITDRDTGQPRGFAFVQMGTPEDAKTAIEKLNGMEVDGRTISVNEARPKTAGVGGGGGGRNFR